MSMEIFLFGGAEVPLGQVKPELKLIEKVIKRLRPKQILHIPFARTDQNESEWKGDWFHRYIHLKGVVYLNAEHKDDIVKARSPLVLISGGSNTDNLIKKITANRKLLNLIKKAPCIIGESAGAKVLGVYCRSKRGRRAGKLVKGLGIIKHTVIEPHYTERRRHALLAREINQARVRYGIGIDCVTAVEFNTDEFPKKFKKIGAGLVEVKMNPEFKR